MFERLKHLLVEYRYQANRLGLAGFEIEIVDPDRDLARASQIARQYGVREADVLIFEAGGRRKYLSAGDLGFQLEQEITSALRTVALSRKPVVYFLMGHGERDIDDFSAHSGYSTVAQALRRDDIQVKMLFLARDRQIPEDCSALIIAGPDRGLSKLEIALIAGFLRKSGRAFILIDPVVHTGLEPVLAEWGVSLARDVVVGGVTRTGRELVVTEYGLHPLTRNLKGIVTVFYMPRSVLPVDDLLTSDNVAADRPKVSVLVSTTKEGWAETDMNQSPPRFDEGEDHPGPVSIALAVEKGPASDIDVEIQPTRLVVVGDSDFVSNGALREGSRGNVDFFLGAMNWLVERESLMPIQGATPGALRIGLDREHMRVAVALMVGSVPLIILFMGLFVSWVRRK